jgi:hypothetical protein
MYVEVASSEIMGNTTRPPAHEDKLLGAYFFGLLRGKKGAPKGLPLARH